MKAILYLSSSLIDFSPGEIRKLSLSSGFRNQNLGITGYLYFQGGTFLQYIEGPEAAVNQVYDSIRRDRRHQIIEMVEQDIIYRRFPAWSMKDMSPMAGTNDTIEQTIIQTVRLFEDNRMSIPENIKAGLFQFMDNLSRVQHLV